MTPQKPKSTNLHPELFLILPILARMEKIEGWLSRREADLMISVTQLAVAMVPGPHVIVEIGSYCGRSTFVLGSVLRHFSPAGKLYAIDPHNGIVGAVGSRLRQTPPTLEKFLNNIAENELTSVVYLKQQLSRDVHLDERIIALFIDGLHDYESVAGDFFRFQNNVIDQGYVLFHDYSWYAGVKRFVDELLSTCNYREVKLVDSLIVIQKMH